MDNLAPTIKIRTKVIHILITNACNLTCGGCNQLVGHFPKQKIFFVPQAKIREHIETAIDVARQDWGQPWFPPHHRHLSIYGGEPTIHPEWPAILRMLQDDYSEWPFVVLTNGREFRDRPKPQTGDKKYEFLMARRDIHAHDRNVFWRTSPKEHIEKFTPTLLAPQDMLQHPDPRYYFELAKQHCPFYDDCETIIYRDRGYFCINAGPMDWLFHDGANGWNLHDSTHPFQRTDAEIEKQAALFCHRCCFCLGHGAAARRPHIDIPLQTLTEKSFASQTNFHALRPDSAQRYNFPITPSDADAAPTCAAPPVTELSSEVRVPPSPVPESHTD